MAHVNYLALRIQQLIESLKLFVIMKVLPTLLSTLDAKISYFIDAGDFITSFTNFIIACKARWGIHYSISLAPQINIPVPLLSIAISADRSRTLVSMISKLN